MRRVFPFVVAALLVAAGAQATTFQMNDEVDGRSTVSYRFQKPNFTGPVEPEFLTGYHEFGFQLPVGATRMLTFDLPLARTGFDGYPTPGDDHWTVGNVGFGLHDHGLGDDGRTSLFFGVSLPTAQRSNWDAFGVGLFSDPQHLYRFVPDLLTARVAVARELLAEPVDGGPYLRFELSPAVTIPTGDLDGDPDILTLYGLGFGLRQGELAIGAELVGNWVVTSDGASFSEASAHFLSFGVEYAAGSLAPSLFYSLPMDDEYDNALDGLLGVRVRYKVD